MCWRGSIGTSVCAKKDLLQRQSRHIEIDVYLHDGANGALLAKQRFSAQAKGSVKFASQSAIGNATIYGNDLGRAWGPLLDQIALWAEDKAACLPFMARVLKIEKNLIYLDAGAEAQLSAEDSLHLHTWQEPPVRATTNLLLGQEKRARGVARLKAIYPGFSIAELIKAPIGLNVRSGDLFYAQ